MKIAVISGGLSREREVSLKSGRAIFHALKNLGHQPLYFDPLTPDFVSQLASSKVDLAFLALHGRYGEDGTIQGICEYLKIPYTGAGVLASALAINKPVSLEIFAAAGIPLPPGKVYQFNPISLNDDAAELSELAEKILSTLGTRLVLKPIREGSSVGMTIFTEGASVDELIEAIPKACGSEQSFLVEQYLPGRELTCGFLNGEALEIVEIIPVNKFYDFEAKYTSGKSSYHCPADLPEAISSQIKNLTLIANRQLYIREFSRADFRMNNQGQLFLLEVNTMPGMTELSLLPMSARAVGLEFDQLIAAMLVTADRNKY